MINKIDKNKERQRRHARVRKKVKGTAETPRLNVYRSLNHIYVQIIDDVKGVTLCSASTMEKDVKAEIKDMTKTEAEDGFSGKLEITLKYVGKNKSVINGLKRISKPGLRAYSNVEDMPKVLNGLGIAILSTNKGIMTDRQAKAANVGGEVLCYVW